MKPPGGDWPVFIVLIAAVVMALAGAGFIGGYALTHASQRDRGPTAASPSPMATEAPTVSPTPTSTPTPTPTLTPTPSPTATPSPTPTPVQCWFGDFPYYPGSWAVAASTNGAEAWHVYESPSRVANYFANGASNLAWHFQLISRTSTQWNFRMQRAPACSGSLTVNADPAGGTLYQATPDSNS